MRDLLRKARTFIECSPLKSVENNSGCIDRDKICAEIDAALAAPARNCDRFATGDLERDAQDAMEAMLDEGVAGYRSMAKYLLSPVHKEQEGGAK